MLKDPPVITHKSLYHFSPLGWVKLVSSHPSHECCQSPSDPATPRRGVVTNNRRLHTELRLQVPSGVIENHCFPHPSPYPSTYQIDFINLEYLIHTCTETLITTHFRYHRIVRGTVPVVLSENAAEAATLFLMFSKPPSTAWF